MELYYIILCYIILCYILYYIISYYDILLLHVYLTCSFIIIIDTYSKVRPVPLQRLIEEQCGVTIGVNSLKLQPAGQCEFCGTCEQLVKQFSGKHSSGTLFMMWVPLENIYIYILYINIYIMYIYIYYYILIIIITYGLSLQAFCFEGKPHWFKSLNLQSLGPAVCHKVTIQTALTQTTKTVS